jgi:mannose-6-phosphate isomerase-like protein (cupin superfamily)
MSASAAYPGHGRELPTGYELVPALLCTEPCSFDITAARERLTERGGYEIVLESPGLEVGVYVLVAPEPDHQQPHVDDEVYVVLEGSGILTIEGERIEVHEGTAAFVPAGANHQFTGYEHLTVLVIFSRR